MGVVTARAAGVEEVVVLTPPPVDPVIRGACALCGVHEVYAMGGAHGVAALAYGTETIERVDVIAGPGQPVSCRRPSARSPTSSASTASTGPATCSCSPTRRPTRELVALDLLAQGEHGPGAPVVAVSRRRARCSTRWRASSRRSRPDAAAPRPGGVRARARRVAADALRFAEAFAPEHLELVGAGAERLAPRVRSAGCVFVGAGGATAFGDYVAGSNHCLPTGGSARFASGLSPRAFRRRMSEVHIGAAARGARRRRARRSRAPRDSPCTPSRWRRASGRMRLVTRWRRTAEIARAAPGDRRPLELGLDGSGAGARQTGVGFLDHMLDLLARHGRLDLDVEARGDLQTGSHHTVEDVGIVLGQALDHALGDRAGIYRYGHAVVPMDEARALCAIDVSGRPFLALDDGGLPPGETGGFDHELLEEFFRAVATNARLTLHLEVRRARTPTT